MGRKSYKVFFCAFCLDQNPDQVADHSFDQDIDVSHLATPLDHPSSNLSLAIESSSNSTPVGDTSSSDDNNNNLHHYQQPLPPPLLPPGQVPQEIQQPELVDNSPLFQPPPQQDNDNNNQLQSLPRPLSENLYELQPQSSSAQVPAQNSPQPPAASIGNNNNNLQLVQNQQALEPLNVQQIPGAAPKLSYDIISVREPLAKILAERQQIQQALLQQRQILGDHEYIEVYGERGSSCFYEEIAGSTTSSATYDQIGASSNHNYQVLINAYANAYANRSNSNQDLANEPVASSSAVGENLYDVASHRRAVTSHVDEVDCPITTAPGVAPIMTTTTTTTSNSEPPQPSTSYDTTTPTNQRKLELTTPQQRPIPTERTTNVSQPTPVYSVINKATRRSNATPRLDTSRPPQPPPKNLQISHHQPSTSAIKSLPNQAETSTTFTNTHNRSGSRGSPQVPTTSSYMSNNSSDFKEQNDHHHGWLPQPPPRFSKLPIYNATNRPLPLPDMFDSTNLKATTSSSIDEDLESINNGYELLASNFDDDQIDVGYEKIRESNRYSNGSISSQFCPIQALDNGGYESVQPIYSSPSNALAEPNYEAIEPATASELAAAATARLTAAATVIEQFLKQDNQS